MMRTSQCQMKRVIPITTLFLDVGGVLPTTGWGHQSRALAAKAFDLNLEEFVDFFISSCFVHFRKPDADIFRLALDVAQVPAEQVVYIDDQPLFVQVAEGLGIQGIRHTNYQSTCETLTSFGLQNDGGVIHGTR